MVTVPSQTRIVLREWMVTRVPVTRFQPVIHSHLVVFSVDKRWRVYRSKQTRGGGGRLYLCIIQKGYWYWFWVQKHSVMTLTSRMASWAWSFLSKKMTRVHKIKHFMPYYCLLNSAFALNLPLLPLPLLSRMNRDTYLDGHNNNKLLNTITIDGEILSKI